MTQQFDDTTLRNISDIVADILTHSKITEMLSSSNIQQAGGNNKTDRIFMLLKKNKD